jgi:hypothetical protein
LTVSGFLPALFAVSLGETGNHPPFPEFCVEAENGFVDQENCFVAAAGRNTTSKRRITSATCFRKSTRPGLPASPSKPKPTTTVHRRPSGIGRAAVVHWPRWPRRPHERPRPLLNFSRVKRAGRSPAPLNRDLPPAEFLKPRATFIGSWALPQTPQLRTASWAMATSMLARAARLANSVGRVLKAWLDLTGFPSCGSTAEAQ